MFIAAKNISYKPHSAECNVTRIMEMFVADRNDKLDSHKLISADINKIVYVQLMFALRHFVLFLLIFCGVT